MAYETTLAASNIIVKDGEGNVILDVEAFDIDCLIAQAQEGVDTSDASMIGVWVERFRESIKEQYSAEINRTNAWQLVQTVEIAMSDLKKKLPSMLT